MLNVRDVYNYSKQDIKDIAITENHIICCGRENVIYITNRSDNTTHEIKPNSGHVNSIVVDENIIYCGFQNGSIKVYKMDGTLMHSLDKHSSNVCVLKKKKDMLVSGSWDHFCKVWDLVERITIYSLEHPATVWCVKILEDNRIITGCADRLLRIYKNGIVEVTISFHNFCIRGVDSISNFIYSIDNEGTLLKTTLEGELVNHKSFKEFMYCVVVTQNGIACCGENGKIYILDDDLRVKAETSAPCASCWKIMEHEQKIYVCGSDGNLYTYVFGNVHDNKQEHITAKTECKQFSNSEGEFKLINNDVYQLINNEWVLIGEKTVQYDHTFNVELEGKYYNLSFNKNDNVYDVAENFLRKNGLNPEYKEEIVQYIKQNFYHSEYKTYETVNKNGVLKQIRQFTNLQYIFKNLDKPNNQDSMNIEKELIWLFQNGVKFVALDLYRYFFVKNLVFDMIFLFKYMPTDRKEALALVRLVTVLYNDPPFNLDCFHPILMNLKDIGYLKNEDLDDYYHNRLISQKKQRNNA